jgi:class 3 adenylate cyclase
VRGLSGYAAGDLDRLWTVTGIPESRYSTTAQGVHIAYQVVGDGPVDLLVCPDAFFAAEQLWQEAGWAAFLEHLASFSRVVLYDRRGTGLSDPITPQQPPSLEQWADDAVAVLDALNCQRAALLGIAEGCFVATVLAATHPERFFALVLVHPVPGRSPAGKGGLFGQTTPVFEKELDAVWRGELDDDTIAAFAPSKRGDAQFRQWLIGALRHSLSPAAARALFEVNFWSNVDPILDAISVPTLVLHRSGNEYVPMDYSRHVAACIPHAAFVAVSGEDHIVNGGDPQPVLGEIEEFLTGTRRDTEPDRVLATVLFTDIVGSTQKAAAMGDRRWLALLDRHDAVATEMTDQYRGRLVRTARTTGDGVLAIFDGPGRAIRCALAMRDELDSLGITIRAGLHTGEVELRGEDVGGIGVHIAARVLEQAGAGQLFVSSAVPMLVVGSGIEFEDRGEHELKGVPGIWRLYSIPSK